MNKEEWREAIGKLPDGLTYREAAAALGRPYSIAYRWLRKFGYVALDGRKCRKPGESKGCRINWAGVNWKLPPPRIAAQYGISRQAVHAMLRRRDKYRAINPRG